MIRAAPDERAHPVDRHVGRRVQERRVASGYSQSELGAALGLTFQQVQKYEKGSNRVSASKLWEIAAFLKVDIGYFFEGLDPEADAPMDLPPAHPATRATAEIARLSPHLPLGRQRLIAAVMRTLIEDAESHEGRAP